MIEVRFKNKSLDLPAFAYLIPPPGKHSLSSLKKQWLRTVAINAEIFRHGDSRVCGIVTVDYLHVANFIVWLCEEKGWQTTSVRSRLDAWQGDEATVREWRKANGHE